MPVVITNCTNRKRGTYNTDLSASSLDRSDVDAVAAQWINRLQIAPANRTARDVYCGRSFREAEASAIALDASLYIVSAGLGIVEANCRVPSYDLTVTSGTANTISNRIISKSTPQSWWSLISRDSPFGISFLDILKKYPNDLVLVALSRPYVELIYEELRQITPEQCTRLRFFGKNLDQFLPIPLACSWMPYDDRLDFTGDGYSGTQTDIAQRALRHFVKEVFLDGHTCASSMTHRSLVLASLADLRTRETPTRMRLNDDDIGATLREHWVRGKGQSTDLLRILRRELGIACEQSRFRAIYHTVKNEMETPK
jgi:hypothetical protein